MAFQKLTMSKWDEAKKRYDRKEVLDAKTASSLASSGYGLETNLGSNKNATGYKSIYASDRPEEKGIYYGLKDYVAPPSIVGGKTESPLSSSTIVLDEVNKLRKQNEDAMKMLGDYRNLITGMTSSSTKQDELFNQWQEKAGKIGNLNDQDLLAIEEAGIRAGEEFDPLIKKAELEKEQGFAKAQVNTGEAGGFMNTQLVGDAADPRMQQKIQELRDLGVNIDFTGAVPDWAGKGGELERVKSVYDNNISQLQAKKQSAILAAKDAMRTAIATGKSADLKAVQDLYQAAVNAHTQANNLTIQKQNALTNLAQTAQTGIRSAYEFAKSGEEIGSMSLGKLSASGIDIKRFTPELKAQYEQQLGIPGGSFDNIYSKLKDVNSLTDTSNQLAITKQIYDVLKDIPEGTKVEILGQEFEGIKPRTGGTDIDAYSKMLDIQAKLNKINGTEPLTASDKFNMEMKISSAVNKYTKDQVDAAGKLSQMEVAYNSAVGQFQEGKSLNAQTQAFITLFNKLLDPASVVRESEYARTGAGQSVANRIEGLANKWQYGGAGMTKSEIDEFYKLSQELLGGYKKQAVNEALPLYKQANNNGLDIQTIFPPNLLSWIEEANIITPEDALNGTTSGTSKWQNW